MTKITTSPLSSADISALEEILFDDRFAEDALDYFGVHGALSALAVGPCEMTPEAWVELAFGRPVSAVDVKEYDFVVQTLSRIFHNIRSELNQEEPIELPAETYEDRDALTNWCAGFVEAFLANEEQWFEQKQELVAEFLLPIMALSNLFDDEDFTEITTNPKLMAQLSEQIPEVLTDLYLLFHSGE